VDKGIPHSKFLEWDSDDRSKLVAYLLEQGERCDMCGTASWEWEENRFAYEPISSFCQGCYQKQVFSDTEHDSLAGTTVTLIPVTSLRKAERKVAAERMREMQKRDKEAERGRRSGAAADS
jgi:hypothetical protein